MTDFHFFIVLFGLGLGLQALGLGLRQHWRVRGLSVRLAWWLWMCGVLLIIAVALHDSDLVLAFGQVMGAIVLHKWLFQKIQ